MSREINQNAPHQSVIVVKAQIMEKTQTGRVDGVPVRTITKLYTVDGKNYQDCVQQTEEFIKRVENNETNSKN